MSTKFLNAGMVLDYRLFFFSCLLTATPNQKKLQAKEQTRRTQNTRAQHPKKNRNHILGGSNNFIDFVGFRLQTNQHSKVSSPIKFHSPMARYQLRLRKQTPVRKSRAVVSMALQHLENSVSAGIFSEFGWMLDGGKPR